MNRWFPRVRPPSIWSRASEGSARFESPIGGGYAGEGFSVEQIVAKLREAEKHQAQGPTIPQTCKRLQISEQTFYRAADQVRRVEEGRGAHVDGARAGERATEEDRRRAGAGYPDAEGSAAGKLVSPARRRDALRFLVKRRRVSERRACRVVGQHRSTQRYTKVPAEYELRLFEYLSLELSASQPDDALVTVELNRSHEGATVVRPSWLRYVPDRALALDQSKAS
jgi:hypothetical protein